MRAVLVSLGSPEHQKPLELGEIQTMALNGAVTGHNNALNNADTRSNHDLNRVSPWWDRKLVVLVELPQPPTSGGDGAGPAGTNTGAMGLGVAIKFLKIKLLERINGAAQGQEPGVGAAPGLGAVAGPGPGPTPGAVTGPELRPEPRPEPGQGVDGRIVERILFVDADAFATDMLYAWMLSSKPILERAWGPPAGVGGGVGIGGGAGGGTDGTGAGRCRAHLVVAAERWGVKSPLNTGIFISHRRCSRPCTAAVLEGHESHSLAGIKANDQRVIVELWRNGTCAIKQLPSAIQRFESPRSMSWLVSQATHPTAALTKPAFAHYTRAEKRGLLPGG